MTAILLTIPPSHYSEKVRWALDRLGKPYVERPMAPPFYMGAVRRAGGRTVPVLLDGETRLYDSTDILRHLDAQAPEDRKLHVGADELEDPLNGDLGRSVRRVAYSRAIHRDDLLIAMLTDRVPPRQALGLRLLLPLLKMGLRRKMGLTPDQIQRARDRVESVLERVEARLADGRPFLSGDRFQAVDLTFAALSAPLFLPPEYGSFLPRPEQLDPDWREQLQSWRDRPAGQFALRLYREHRRA